MIKNQTKNVLLPQWFFGKKSAYWQTDAKRLISTIITSFESLLQILIQIQKMFNPFLIGVSYQEHRLSKPKHANRKPNYCQLQ